LMHTQLLSWVPETKPSRGTASRGTGSPVKQCNGSLWDGRWIIVLLTGALMISVQGRRALLSPLPTVPVGQFRCVPLRARDKHTPSTGHPQQRHAELLKAAKRLASNMFLNLLLVPITYGLMSGDTCNFPLTEAGLVDTCNLTTNVEAYQVVLESHPAVACVLGSTMEVQYRSQLGLARGPAKRCRQHGEIFISWLFSIVINHFSSPAGLQWWICQFLKLLRRERKNEVGWWLKSRYM